MSSEARPHSRRRRRPARVVLPLAIVALAALLASCGKKGAPMPPPSRLPKPVSDLLVEQWGETVRLQFSYPAETVGGLPLNGIKGVEVWEVVRPFVAQPVAPTPAAGAPSTEAPTTEAPGTESPGTETAQTEEATAQPQGEATEEPKPATAEQPQAGEAEQAHAGEEGQPPAAAEAPLFGAPSVAAMPPPIPTIAPGDFKANAKQVTTIEGDQLEAAILGGKILLEIPASSLHTLPPAPPESSDTTAAGEPPAEAAPESAPAEEEAAESGPTEGTETTASSAPAQPAAKPVVEEVHFLAVRTISEQGKTSDFSRPAYLIAGTPPPTPGGLRAVPGEYGISLGWTPLSAPDLEGIHIYRRDREESVFTKALTTLPADAVRYVDRTAQFGHEYTYALSAVGRQTPLLQSALSETATLQYTDVYEPQPPARLDLFAEPTRVRLIWEAPTAPDVAGYRVERAGTDGHFVILNSEMVTTPEYIDHDVRRGATYSYRVVALDTAGNASEPSPVETTRIP